MSICDRPLKHNIDSPLALSSTSKAMSANNSCNKLGLCEREASACDKLSTKKKKITGYKCNTDIK